MLPLIHHIPLRRHTPLHTQVVDTIVELAQIMRDLSTLVVEQGTMLDRVDHNIVTAAIKVGSSFRLALLCSSPA